MADSSPSRELGDLDDCPGPALHRERAVRLGRDDRAVLPPRVRDAAGAGAGRPGGHVNDGRPRIGKDRADEIARRRGEVDVPPDPARIVGRRGERLPRVRHGEHARRVRVRERLVPIREAVAEDPARDRVWSSGPAGRCRRIIREGPEGLIEQEAPGDSVRRRVGARHAVGVQQTEIEAGVGQEQFGVDGTSSEEDQREQGHGPHGTLQIVAMSQAKATI